MSDLSSEISFTNLYYSDEEAAAVGEEICNNWDVDTWIPNQQSPPFDENFISSLIDRELQHMPLPDYLQRCHDCARVITYRQDAINWIFKVHAAFDFKPVTALLSINYLDRYLSIRCLPQEGWSFRLLSVACLSLAAKMEELLVPPLLHLQLMEPDFMFESKTVQEMEIRILLALNWRLNSVTPLDYLHYFISKLPSSSPNSSSHSWLFYSSSDLIFSTARVVNFLRFPPSTIAAAAVLCVAGKSSDTPAVFHERVDSEMLRSCLQLMEQYIIDACPFGTQLKVSGARLLAAHPPSPNAILDAATCASCHSHSQNPGSKSQAEAGAD